MDWFKFTQNICSSYWDSNFDDHRDQMMIKLGSNLYDKNNTNDTMSSYKHPIIL